jgi:hypothetical protein
MWTLATLATLGRGAITLSTCLIICLCSLALSLLSYWLHSGARRGATLVWTGLKLARTILTIGLRNVGFYVSSRNLRHVPRYSGKSLNWRHVLSAEAKTPTTTIPPLLGKEPRTNPELAMLWPHGDGGPLI